MIYVTDPLKYAAVMGRGMGLGPRRLSGFGFGDVNDPCVNPDGTINNSCVASQSANEASSIISQADSINASSYSVCESNLALNNSQRSSLGLPALPDTCASQFPPNANVTVYTGYGNFESGSGSAPGTYYYGDGSTPTVAANQVATSTSPASPAPVPQTVTAPTVNTALPAAYQTAQSIANAAAAAGANSSAPSAGDASAGGGTSVPASGATSLFPASIASDLSGVPDWAWFAAGGLLLFMLLRK